MSVTKKDLARARMIADECLAIVVETAKEFRYARMLSLREDQKEANAISQNISCRKETEALRLWEAAYELDARARKEFEAIEATYFAGREDIWAPYRTAIEEAQAVYDAKQHDFHDAEICLGNNGTWGSAEREDAMFKVRVAMSELRLASEKVQGAWELYAKALEGKFLRGKGEQ